MNDQIKIILLVSCTQLPPHVVCLIWRACDVHLPSIWSQKLSNSLSSVMDMWVMVDVRCVQRTRRRVDAANQSVRSVRHVAHARETLFCATIAELEMTGLYDMGLLSYIS